MSFVTSYLMEKKRKKRHYQEEWSKIPKDHLTGAAGEPGSSNPVLTKAQAAFNSWENLSWAAI